MTSDKTGSTVVSSAAHIQLQYALGKHRVNLAELSQEELGEFLFEQLHKVELKELRGFTPICDVLSRRGDKPIDVADTYDTHLGWLRESSISLRTQAVSVFRGVCRQTLTFKRLESDEETTSLFEAQGWGKSAYLSSGEECILVLVRLPHHSQADRNLVALDYRYKKVPHKERYIIDSVTTTLLSRENFCSFFGEKAPGIARDLLWELRTVYSRTLDDLVHQAEKIRCKVEAWDQLGGKIA